MLFTVCFNDSVYMCVCLHVAVDCGPLSPPENGNVELIGTTFGEEVEYSCVTGYSLNGSPTRECQANGEWSGDEPSCISEIII